jgi:hypothetical protein
MFEILAIFILVYIGFILGQAYQIFKVRSMIRRIARDNDINLEEVLYEEEPENSKQEIMVLEAEKINGTLLIYNKLTNEFICQAETIEEAARTFNDRKKDVYGLIKYDETEMMFVGGKIEKSKK